MGTCKHDWFFVNGTDVLKCKRCGEVTRPRPNTIRFYNGAPDSTEVLRISKDGIWANPDVPTDEAAKKVLEALGGHLTQMLDKAREEALAQEPVAYLCENAAGHRYFRWKKPSGMYKPIALYTKEKNT